MTFNSSLAWLLGLEEGLDSVNATEISFARPWANEQPLLVAVLAVAAVALSLIFYLKAQRRGSTAARVLLALCRGCLLALLIAILGDPILKISYNNSPRPLLYVLLDGTDSMGIADAVAPAQRAALDKAVGLDPSGAAAGETEDEPIILTRMQYVQALLRKKDDNPLRDLQDDFRLRYFLMSRRDGVDSLLESDAMQASIDPAKIASRLTTTGQITNLSVALDDILNKHATRRLAGLIVLSDFDQNSGPPPSGDANSPAAKLGVPIYAVGIGPASAVDLKVDLVVPPVMKKAEKRMISVTLEQQGLDGRSVTVHLRGRQIGADPSSTQTIDIGSRTVTLTDHVVTTDPFEFIPNTAGPFELIAQVEPLEEETITANNLIQRKVEILDDFLRLLYVEYEPSWEWRFIKEVFHRDRLVGMRGFRTYLHSAHPRVKQTQDLFVSSLTPRSRSEFFANDVIFLGDVPSSMLTRAFCERLEEFVGTFGGGLVVMAGPRFGPGQLAHVGSSAGMDLALEKLRHMLPVEIDPSGKAKESDFRMKITPLGRQTEFMRLPGTDERHQGAWDNLGRLPWYQPVRKPHRLARVLAEHPTDMCPDAPDRHQPLIAIRPYGKGQVVYIGFNETWRLRRKYGEQYYRQFWGQLIHHLGFSHALGGGKRFVVRLDSDQRRYQVGDTVILTAEAYDENFDEITADQYPKTEARLFRPDRSGRPSDSQSAETFNVPLLRAGVFEARFPVFAEGTYCIQLKDPVTGEWREPITFTALGRSAERRSAVRNIRIQNDLATSSGGQSYDLTTVARLSRDLRAEPLVQTSIEIRKLWTTWLCFGLVVLLMLGEWLARKMVNLQ